MLACYFHIAASLFQLKICQSGIRESQKFSKHLLVVRTGIEPPEYFLVFPKYGIFMETVEITISAKYFAALVIGSQGVSFKNFEINSWFLNTLNGLDVERLEPNLMVSDSLSFGSNARS